MGCMLTTVELVAWAGDHTTQLEADMTFRQGDYGWWWAATVPAAESKIRTRAYTALDFLDRFAGADSQRAIRGRASFDKNEHSMETGARELGEVLRAWADQVEAGIVPIRQIDAQGARAVASSDLMEQVQKLTEDGDVHPELSSPPPCWPRPCLLAACGGSASHAAGQAATTATAAASSAAAAPSSSAAPPPLTCSTSTNDNGMTASQVIAQLVSDQKSQDASQEQNWVDLVSGSQTGQGSDLAAAAQSLGSYSGTQLAADASQFGTDAQTFLSDQSGGLLPGWVTEYRQVETDIHKLADDCGQSFPRPAGA